MPVPACVFRCGRCRRVGYRGRPHQAAHWKAGHKPGCVASVDSLAIVKLPARRVGEAVAAALAVGARENLALDERVAALPPLPLWDVRAMGAPAAAILGAWEQAAARGNPMGEFCGLFFDMALWSLF